MILGYLHFVLPFAMITWRYLFLTYRNSQQINLTISCNSCFVLGCAAFSFQLVVYHIVYCGSNLVSVCFNYLFQHIRICSCTVNTLRDQVLHLCKMCTYALKRAQFQTFKNIQNLAREVYTVSTLRDLQVSQNSLNEIWCNYKAPICAYTAKLVLICCQLQCYKLIKAFEILYS